jgi:hypothetical protein
LCHPVLHESYDIKIILHTTIQIEIYIHITIQIETIVEKKNNNKGTAAGSDFAGVLTVNSKAVDADKAKKLADRWAQIGPHAFTASTLPENLANAAGGPRRTDGMTEMI